MISAYTRNPQNAEAFAQTPLARWFTDLDQAITESHCDVVTSACRTFTIAVMAAAKVANTSSSRSHSV